MEKRILIVAAHPDDEILGCGGTATRLASEKNEVFVAILGEGFKRAEGYHALLKEQAGEACRVLGAKDPFFFDFPDNQFDTLPLLEIVEKIEGLKDRIQPDVVFTHFWNDLNVDHRITFQAVQTAIRPLPGETVKEIYSFEVPSSSEWNFSTHFQPDLFYDISETMALKLEAMKKYEKELQVFPHPRSLEGLEVCARHWGMKIGVPYAEAFKVVRILRSR